MPTITIIMVVLIIYQSPDASCEMLSWFPREKFCVSDTAAGVDTGSCVVGTSAGDGSLGVRVVNNAVGAPAGSGAVGDALTSGGLFQPRRYSGSAVRRMSVGVSL